MGRLAALGDDGVGLLLELLGVQLRGGEPVAQGGEAGAGGEGCDAWKGVLAAGLAGAAEADSVVVRPGLDVLAVTCSQEVQRSGQLVGGSLVEPAGQFKVVTEVGVGDRPAKKRITPAISADAELRRPPRARQRAPQARRKLPGVLRKLPEAVVGY